jgi:feruloyl esterase
MPAFCRVAATLTPTSDSVIKMEVWMPDSGWNGRFEGVGGGGFAGTIVYGSLAPAVKLGYAVASTDTGSTSDGSFAFGHPQKIIDFGYRGIHLMTVIGKQITAAFYGEHPRYSYFSGCSTGGRQAGMEAQRYPDDYDGIVQGDPALYQTHHEVGAHLYITWQMFASTSGGVLEDTASTVYTDQDTLLGNAVNAACDAKDGVVDGVLNDPRECHYNPEGLLCTGAQTPPNCLTAAQVQTVKNIWRGPDWMVHQRGYYPAIERGGEALGWPGWNSPVRGGTPTDTHASLGLPFFLYFIFDNPTWDFQTFNWNSDPAYVDNKVVVPGQTMAQVLNATNPDLRRFRSKGGKLIHYHGFSDPDIPTQISINYFDSVVNFNWGSLERTQDFYRLFLVPGMNHCSGGPGANVFDMLTPLVQWVENGIAPKSILATHYVNNSATQGVAFTRPLCPYPQEAVYTGSGSNTDAANFVCKQSKAIEHDVYELFKLFEHDR